MSSTPIGAGVESGTNTPYNEGGRREEERGGKERKEK